MTRRRAITAAATLGLALLLLAMGAAARPLFIEQRPPSTPVLNSTEIAFAQDMLAHHSQALIMIARLDQGADPTVVALARRIEATQREEIGELKGWLRLAGASTVNPAPMAWMHPDTGVAHHHAAAPSGAAVGGVMPGMATQSELDALSATRGTDAARSFLQMMTRHHYGGVQMARAANDLLTGGIVKQTARDMMTSQAQEAGLMEIMYSSLTTAR
ncbi:DUF305 domain-containing protein [Nocardia gamkensis]|uniref:DUF305 domain-containing protein n=1 Tax=Nocardia gamkensis TaxID=352869 RepID=A0A7X6R4K1_9NOCA|nr:DUF305 domain-containing protein [Nocardia gamkensis]NKY28554.1 DUF305 domain-containing protein [Nocardia gamkensis]NQE71299.1 hypothetical protein [Nocardia gamkensis]